MALSRCNRLTRRSAALVLATMLLAVAAAGERARAQNATVRLVVDYGDGVIKTITDLPWAKGSTVLDVMNAAKDRPHGIAFSYTGSGASMRSSRASTTSPTRAALRRRKIGSCGSIPAMLTKASVYTRCSRWTWCSGASRRKQGNDSAGK
jgi:hypothetical protein